MGQVLFSKFPGVQSTYNKHDQGDRLLCLVSSASPLVSNPGLHLIYKSFVFCTLFFSSPSRPSLVVQADFFKRNLRPPPQDTPLAIMSSFIEDDSIIVCLAYSII